MKLVCESRNENRLRGGEASALASLSRIEKRRFCASARRTIALAALLIAADGQRALAVDSEIVLCLDVSQSISQAELDLEKAGLLDCLNNTAIIPHDGTVAVGIVTYGHIAWNVLGLTPVTDANITNIFQPALAAVTRDPVAQTNITAGLNLAQTMLTGVGSTTSNDFILLAGDGAHNTGAPEPETTCPQVRNAGTTICSIAIDASTSGIADLQNCAAPPDGQFGEADTFADFGPVCQACLAFFLDVQCEGPTVCTNPGVCTANVPCSDIAECEAPPGTQLVRQCTPGGPYGLGTSSVDILCTANGDVIEESSCSVTVNDCENPQITCPAPASISCTASTAPGNTGTATASDNCGSPAITISQEQTIPGNCANNYVLKRTWTATDASGNSVSCVQNITVSDTSNPSIVCPSSIELICDDPAGATAEDVYFNLGVNDNCDTSVELTDDRPMGFFPPTCAGLNPPTVVNFTAEDNCGNTIECSVPVYVTGNTCCPRYIENDTDLTLLPMNIDLRQETAGPVTTKAHFDIWNSNEVRFSGTERCLTCWDQTLLGTYGLPNHFLLDALQTDKGKARINGIPSPVVCDDPLTTSVNVPMLGLSIKEMTLVESGTVAMRAASTLTGFGTEPGKILVDIPTGPPGEPIVVSAPPPPPPDHDGLEGLPPSNNGPFLAALEQEGGISKKGSLIVWPKIELKWNAQGELIQDTFVSLLNDNLSEVEVQFYQVNGDEPTPPVFQNGVLVERGHPGWNKSDFRAVFTGDESNYWSSATGQPKGVSPFWVLDPGNPMGRPDPDPTNPGGRIVRGFLLAWAVDGNNTEIRWNHLAGSATVVNFRDTTAWEYNAWSFQCITEALTGDPCDEVPGVLNLDGTEYDVTPDRLILDFFATGSRAFSPP